jgi:hypothetical protein
LVKSSRKKKDATLIASSTGEVLIYFRLRIVAPSIALSNMRTMKIKKIVFAIEAAPAAMLVKPNIAAIIAITRKIAVHFSIVFNL